MHLLYLDDSGSVDDNNVNYVVLGGVCVEESNVKWLTHEVEKIAESISPGKAAQVEFHAAEIYQGKNEPWKSLNKSERIETICKVLRTVQKAFETVSVFAVAVEKKPMSRDEMHIAYEKISQFFNSHLERDFDPPERGLILLDKSSYETGLQALASEIRRTGNKKGSQNRSIIEIPVFVDSKASRLIQLADHISYAVFRKYNAHDTKYFSEVEGRFLFKNQNCHSLSHVTTNKYCTCPACLTRRTYEERSNLLG